MFIFLQKSLIYAFLGLTYELVTFYDHSLLLDFFIKENQKNLTKIKEDHETKRCKILT